MCDNEALVNYQMDPEATAYLNTFTISFTDNFIYKSSFLFNYISIKSLQILNFDQ